MHPPKACPKCGSYMTVEKMEVPYYKCLHCGSRDYIPCKTSKFFGATYECVECDRCGRQFMRFTKHRTSCTRCIDAAHAKRRREWHKSRRKRRVNGCHR